MTGRYRWFLDWDEFYEVLEYSYDIDVDDLMVVDSWGNAVPAEELVNTRKEDGEHDG